jgi:hypothetical protein
MSSFWKTAVLASVLLAFLCVGIAHIIHPDWFIKRSGVRKGGELLTEWNRIGFQFSGAVLAAFAAYLRYVVFRR